MSLAAPAGIYGSQVSEVRFADPLDGWLFGPDLFVTHDGGRTWHRVATSGSVRQLETSGGYVDAVVSSCAPNGCSGRLRLEQAAATGGPFTTVLVSTARHSSSQLSLQADVGFVVFGDFQLYATENLANSAGWKPFPNPCASLRNFVLGPIVAPNTTTLVSVCWGNGAAGSSTKDVVVTRDAKSTVVGRTPLGGLPVAIAATPSGRTIVVACSSGASMLYRSRTGGRSWSTVASFGDGGYGWNDLGFTTATQGFVMRGAASIWRFAHFDEMLMTHDAGASWHRVRFS
jgi:photosystem II stability/assembly factor-like uncharacterized protein